METLQPQSSTYAIRKPTQFTEFEIQSFIYSSFRNAGIDVRGEVTFIMPQSPEGRRAKCRFDIVVFVGSAATEIIEVKAVNVASPKTEFMTHRQPRKYTQFGIPVTFVRGMEEAKEFVAARCF